MKTLILLGFDFELSNQIAAALNHQYQENRPVLDCLRMYHDAERRLNIFSLKETSSLEDYKKWMRYMYRLRGIQPNQIILATRVGTTNSLMIYLNRMLKNYSSSQIEILIVSIPGTFTVTDTPNYHCWSLLGDSKDAPQHCNLREISTDLIVEGSFEWDRLVEGNGRTSKSDISV